MRKVKVIGKGVIFLCLTYCYSVQPNTHSVMSILAVMHHVYALISEEYFTAYNIFML